MILKAIPTLHPSYIIKDQTMAPVVVNDFTKGTTVPPEYYKIFPDLEMVQEFVATSFAFDIENDPATHHITMIGLCYKPYHVIVVPFEGPYIKELKRIFIAAEEVYGHNIIQHDLPIMLENGVPTNPDIQVWDTMLIHHLLFPQFSGDASNEQDERGKTTMGGHGLEFCSSQFTQKPCWKHVGLNTPTYWEMRNARDTDVTLQIGRVLVPMLKQQALLNLYQNKQKHLAKICYEMRVWGIKRDPNRLVELRDRLVAEIQKEERNLPAELRSFQYKRRKRIPAPPGTLGKSGKPVKYTHIEIEETEIPWRSNDTLKTYLYTKLRLPVQKHIKSKKATVNKLALTMLLKYAKRGDFSWLDKDRLVHTLTALQKLKKDDKLISSFVSDEVKPTDRIHPHFNVHGTNSGRLSCSNPNMQQQPEAARFMYVPSHADWQIVSVDWSGIENRLTAWFAQDNERLARMMQPGFNEHKWAASLFFGIPIDEVEKSHDNESPYKKAKIINHGCDGGIGARKISKMNDIPYQTVKELIFKWKEVNAKTVAWQEEIGAQAKREGFLANPFGRKGWFYTQRYYTKSVRFPAQSTTADICFNAMIGLYYDRIGLTEQEAQRVSPKLGPLPPHAHLLAQVHDELVVECPTFELADTIEAMVRVMSQPWRELGGLSIPVEVSVAPPGASWAECEKIEIEDYVAA